MTAPATTTRMTEAQQRAKLMRIIHAEGHKRGLDHAALTEGAALGYQVSSLSELTLPQLRDYIQRLGTRGRVPEERTGERRRENEPANAGRTKRPSGKRRPEGVVWLPTPKQRKFIADLLEQLFGGHPDPLAAGTAYARSKIGPELPANALFSDLAGLAEAITTGKAASILINSLVGEIKRRGLWGGR